MKHKHYHHHPGIEGHDERHIHSEERSHHGPAFGKRQVVEVADAIEEKWPDYTALLRMSVEKILRERERDN